MLYIKICEYICRCLYVYVHECTLLQSWNNGRKFPCAVFRLLMVYIMPSHAADCDRYLVFIETSKHRNHDFTVVLRIRDRSSKQISAIC